jgi:hypothetical protein
MTAIWFFARNCRVRIEMWDGSLSWWSSLFSPKFGATSSHVFAANGRSRTPEFTVWPVGIGDSRYHNCCLDGGNSSEYFGYHLVDIWKIWASLCQSMDWLFVDNILSTRSEKIHKISLGLSAVRVEEWNLTFRRSALSPTSTAWWLVIGEITGFRRYLLKVFVFLGRYVALAVSCQPFEAANLFHLQRSSILLVLLDPWKWDR